MTQSVQLTGIAVEEVKNSSKLLFFVASRRSTFVQIAAKCVSAQISDLNSGE